MTGALAPFDFRGSAVRVVVVNDEPRFVASDVCRALGLTNTSKALNGIDSDEKGVTVADTPGGPQDVLVVSESGLYHLIFQSRKPVAVEFRRWVTAEVLPTIRRTGGYGIQTSPIPSGIDVEALRFVLAPLVRSLAAEALDANFRLLRTEIRATETWTLEEWARRKRVSLTARQARSIGGALATVCRGAGLPMGRQASEYRRGTPPRTYPRTVLELHFARLVDRHAPSPQLALVAPASQAPPAPQVPA